jgi:hypothetical protein
MTSTARRNNQPSRGTSAAPVFLLVLLICALGFVVYQRAVWKEPAAPSGADAAATPSATAEPTPQITPEATPKTTPVPTEEPIPGFDPRAAAGTEPAKLIGGTDILVDGEAVEAYAGSEEMDFGFGEAYSALPGVITFRGNNFRDSASYGTAALVSRSFGGHWTVSTGALSGADGTTWTGNGWTGQPLIVKWPAETKRAMNLYDWAKADGDLVEVIYAAMDGYVYFLDLKSGDATRDRLYLGYTFKGAGALDPRGYPLLYLGAGYNSSGAARMFSWSAFWTAASCMNSAGATASRTGPGNMFDSSPLVDAETDTLIYPGENGILYLAKLNSVYDEAAEPSRWTRRSSDGDIPPTGVMWLGMEDSAACWRGPSS